MDKTNIADIVFDYIESGILNQRDLTKVYLYSVITSSAALAGSTLTADENQVLFEKGLPAPGKLMIEQMMNLDLLDAYIYGYSLVERGISLDKDMLKSLAATVMRRTGSVSTTKAGNFDSSKGDLRLCNVTAGDGGKSYVPYRKVPQRFEEFSLWLLEALSRLDPADTYRCYALSFEAYFRLITIHPWADGNGRTARLLMNMIQYMAGVPQCRILLKDKAKYIQALSDAREHDDIQIFIDVMMKLHADDLNSQMNVYSKVLVDDDGRCTATTKGSTRRAKDKPLPVRVDPEDERIKDLRERLRYEIPGYPKDRDIMMRFCEYVYLNPHATITEITKYLDTPYEKVSFYIKILTVSKILKREGTRVKSHWVFDKALFEEEQ